MRKKTENAEKMEVWDVKRYICEEADGGSLISIYSNDIFGDHPTYQFFQLTCYLDTYRRIMDAMDGAVVMEIEEPYREDGQGTYTQIQFWDENGDSECIVVGQIRLPFGETKISDPYEITALADFIRDIEENCK